MRRHILGALAIAFVVTSAVTACGSGGTTRSRSTGAAASTSQDSRPVTVRGPLGGKVLDKGVCAWVETEQGRVEIWVDKAHGQVLSFLPDDTFEGIRVVDATDPDGVGAILFRPGQPVVVTGSRYSSTPGCGTYGVTAGGPISG